VTGKEGLKGEGEGDTSGGYTGIAMLSNAAVVQMLHAGYTVGTNTKSAGGSI